MILIVYLVPVTVRPVLVDCNRVGKLLKNVDLNSKYPLQTCLMTSSVFVGKWTTEHLKVSGKMLSLTSRTVIAASVILAGRLIRDDRSATQCDMQRYKCLLVLEGCGRSNLIDLGSLSAAPIIQLICTYSAPAPGLKHCTNTHEHGGLVQPYVLQSVTTQQSHPNQ